RVVGFDPCLETIPSRRQWLFQGENDLRVVALGCSPFLVEKGAPEAELLGRKQVDRRSHPCPLLAACDRRKRKLDGWHPDAGRTALNGRGRIGRRTRSISDYPDVRRSDRH